VGAPQQEMIAYAIAQHDGARGVGLCIGAALDFLSGRAVRAPRRVRFADVVRIAEDAGIGAIPIMAGIGFLLGLILAFQSAIPMQRFGAQIFVADLLGIAMLRAPAPLLRRTPGRCAA